MSPTVWGGWKEARGWLAFGNIKGCRFAMLHLACPAGVYVVAMRAVQGCLFNVGVVHDVLNTCICQLYRADSALRPLSGVNLSMGQIPRSWGKSVHGRVSGEICLRAGSEADLLVGEFQGQNLLMGSFLGQISLCAISGANLVIGQFPGRGIFLRLRFRVLSIYGPVRDESVCGPVFRGSFIRWPVSGQNEKKDELVDICSRTA